MFVIRGVELGSEGAGEQGFFVIERTEGCKSFCVESAGGLGRVLAVNKLVAVVPRFADVEEKGKEEEG